MGGDARRAKCCCNSVPSITIMGTQYSSSGYLYVLKTDLSTFTWERVEARLGIRFLTPLIFRDSVVPSRVHMRYTRDGGTYDGYWTYGSTGAWTYKTCVIGKNGSSGISPALANGLSVTGYTGTQRNISRYVPATDSYNTENINYVPGGAKLIFDDTNHERTIVSGVVTLARYTGSTTWQVSSTVGAGYNIRNFVIHADNDYCLNNNASETRVSVWDGSNWTHYTVESNSSAWGDIAVDSSGFVHLIYSKGNNLYYATNLTGAYVVTQIATASNPISNMKLLLLTGFPVAVYTTYATGYTLHVASKPSTTWNTIDCAEMDGARAIAPEFIDACI